MQLLAAFADGLAPSDASLSFPLAGSGKPALLRDLMKVPISAWQNFGGHLLGKAVNARALSQFPRDAAAKRSLQLICKPVLLCPIVSAHDSSCISLQHSSKCERLVGVWACSLKASGCQCFIYKSHAWQHLHEGLVKGSSLPFAISSGPSCRL